MANLPTSKSPNKAETLKGRCSAPPFFFALWADDGAISFCSWLFTFLFLTFYFLLCLSLSFLYFTKVTPYKGLKKYFIIIGRCPIPRFIFLRAQENETKRRAPQRLFLYGLYRHCPVNSGNSLRSDSTEFFSLPVPRIPETIQGGIYRDNRKIDTPVSFVLGHSPTPDRSRKHA
jgi:hypothetical protein